MKDGSKDITTHKALLVFHSRVLPLGDVKEEQGGTQHLLSFLIFFVATLSSEGRRVFFFFSSRSHTYSHIPIITYYTIYCTSLYWNYLVTKFNSHLHKCQRSMVDIISKLLWEVFYLEIFFVIFMNSTYVNYARFS